MFICSEKLWKRLCAGVVSPLNSFPPCFCSSPGAGSTTSHVISWTRRRRQSLSLRPPNRDGRTLCFSLVHRVPQKSWKACRSAAGFIYGLPAAAVFWEKNKQSLASWCWCCSQGGCKLTETNNKPTTRPSKDARSCETSQTFRNRHESEQEQLLNWRVHNSGEHFFIFWMLQPSSKVDRRRFYKDRKSRLSHREKENI